MFCLVLVSLTTYIYLIIFNGICQYYRIRPKIKLFLCREDFTDLFDISRPARSVEPFKAFELELVGIGWTLERTEVDIFLAGILGILDGLCHHAEAHVLGRSIQVIERIRVVEDVSICIGDAITERRGRRMQGVGEQVIEVALRRVGQHLLDFECAHDARAELGVVEVFGKFAELEIILGKREVCASESDIGDFLEDTPILARELKL